jgi:hypothetical protein
VNLNSIANGLVRAVTPNEQLSIQVSTGYTTAANGKRTPTYAAAVTAFGQVQALSASEIQKLDFLNIQGERSAIYIDGRVDGLIRDKNKGGDLITRPDQTVWLVVNVLEYWTDWCKVAVTRQNPTLKAERCPR